MSRVLASEGGFTLAELLIASVLTLAIMASALALAHPAERTFRTQLEVIDTTQRLRAAVDALTSDMLLAGSGLADNMPGLALFTASSGAQGLTVRYAMPGAGGALTEHSYYVIDDEESDRHGLRRWNGTSDVPVVDHVESVTFTCMDALGNSKLCDDVAVAKIHTVLRMQVQQAYMRSGGLLGVRDQEVAFDVAPRVRGRVDGTWP